MLGKYMMETIANWDTWLPYIFFHTEKPHKLQLDFFHMNFCTEDSYTSSLLPHRSFGRGQHRGRSECPGLCSQEWEYGLTAREKLDREMRSSYIWTESARQKEEEEDFSVKLPHQHAETMVRKSWELGMCHWGRYCTNRSSEPTTTAVGKELNYNKSVQRGIRKTEHHRTPHLSYKKQDLFDRQTAGYQRDRFLRDGGNVGAGGDWTVQKYPSGIGSKKKKKDGGLQFCVDI